MRCLWLTVVGLLLATGGAAYAQDEEESAAPDTWLGCWSRIYDATHLAKHPGQKVSSMTLSIAARGSESGDAPGKYLAKVTAMLRDKPGLYSNLDGARCVTGEGKLSCFSDGFFVGKFTLEPSGKNMKLALRGDDEHLALVPGIDIDALTVLTPKNPEHALFLLNPAPAKTCAR
jgi:hypothetical protein